MRPRSRTRGRPALLYEYNADRVRVMSLYVGLRYAELSLCDGLGRPACPSIEFTPGWEPEHVVDEAATRLTEMLDEHHVDRQRCHIAAVVHGTVDTNVGRASSVSMGWESVALGAMLRDELGVDVTVHEASRAAAIAEHREGAAAGSEHVLVLNLGPEVAATEVRSGTVETGDSGFAGVIGKCPVPGGERIVPLDEIVGSFPLKRLYNERSSSPVEWMSEVYDRARSGDQHARAVVAVQTEGIAFAASWLMAAVNPDRLVLTGALTDYDEQAKAQMYAAILEQTDERLTRTCTIRFSTLGRQAWARGGVHAALDRHRQLEAVGAA